MRGSHGVAAQPPSGPFFGNGQNGDLVVSSGQTVYTDTIRTALPSGVAAGQNTLPIGTASGFAAGQEILIIQMVGPGAGLYEFGTIQSISSNSLTLAQNLVNSYAQGGPSTTQVLLVSNYQNVTVAGGGILTAHAWDGSTGGIVVFRASGTLNVQSGGIIQTNTSGFRGGIIPNTGWTSSGADQSL